MTSRPADLLARAVQGDLSWVDTESWDCEALVRSSEHHGITALLWSALQGRPGSPAALVGRLGSAVTAEVARSAVQERELASVLRAFAEHGVDAIVVKGAALAYTCYEQPWLRKRTDTDVLIEREWLEFAAGALGAAGYMPATALSTGEFVSHQAAFERRDEHGVSHVVDVHWKAVNPQILADAVSFKSVRTGSRLVSRPGLTLRVPDPSWSLLLACVHRLAHHQDQERLGWLFDIHLLARDLGASGWDHFIAIAAAQRVSAICADGLEASMRLVGASVPGHVIQILKHAGQGDPSKAYTEREQPRLAVLRDDLRHLPRWRDRARLLREHAFPSASFMMSRYSGRRRAWLPAFYVHRLVTGAWKWMRT